MVIILHAVVMQTIRFGNSCKCVKELKASLILSNRNSISPTHKVYFPLTQMLTHVEIDIDL